MIRKPWLVALTLASCRPEQPSPVAADDGEQAPAPAEVPARRSPPSTPEGMARIPGGPGPISEYGTRGPAVRYAFFIDKLETTVGEYQACVNAGACTPASDGGDSRERHCTTGKGPDLPINCVSYRQAESYCAWREKRLLSKEEWHWAARGEQRWTPWGGKVTDCEHANTSIQARTSYTGCVPDGGPWPVGTAPLGATPQGVLDLLGNVSEYVDVNAVTSGYIRFWATTAGSSWASKPEFVRGVESAEHDYLGNPFSSAGRDPEYPGTDRAGIRCGADAVIKPTPPPKMAFLHEGGTAFVREQPIAIQTPFFLDTFEATVEEYAACVDSGQCTPPHASTPEHACTADTDGPAKRPVNCITHAQAEAFCHAQGKRLPTAAQWQWAMQGQDLKSNYPWGAMEPKDCTVANANADPIGCGFDGPWPVVQASLSDTPEGIHDMIGNVSEWTASAGDTPDHRLHAGRGWKATLDDLRFRVAPNDEILNDPNASKLLIKLNKGQRSTIIASAPADTWSDQIGVRCALDAPKAIEEAQSP